MIAFLEGEIQYITDQELILSVSGVGYLVVINESLRRSLGAIGERAALHIYTHVREDALMLFGFSDRSQLDFFQTLLGVSGVGPKMAMTISGSLDLNELARTVAQDDSSLLQSVSGVGKKTAQRLLLELKEVMPAFALSAASSGDSVRDGDVVEALQAMGYSHGVALEALRHAKGDTVEEKTSSALRILGKRS